MPTSFLRSFPPLDSPVIFVAFLVSLPQPVLINLFHTHLDVYRDWKEHKSICKNNFAAPYMQTVRAGTKRLTGGNAAKLGLIGLGPNDSEFDSDTSNAKKVTVVDRLKGL